jgi:Glycerol-3-phosphate responsive antiterminator (mRNA-binding)
MNDIKSLFSSSPIIAAVKSDDLMREAAKSNVKVIFVLYGSILTIADTVRYLKDNGKTVIVHIDLIQGLSGRDVAVDFIKQNTEADGIISTKQNLVKYALDLGLVAGERTFIVDSIAKENIKTHLKAFEPSFLEVMPGVITKVITELVSSTQVPIVAGGLVSDAEDLAAIARSGASAVSTSNVALWG